MSLEYLIVRFSSKRLADDAKAMLRRDNFAFIDLGDVEIEIDMSMENKLHMSVLVKRWGQ